MATIASMVQNPDMTWRQSTAACALLTGALALAACGSSGSGSTGSTDGSTASGSTGNTSAAGSTTSTATGSTAAGALHGAITVDAAASLTEAFTTIATQFKSAHPGTSITLKFGASSDLATQITQGDAVDVFASASPKNMASVVAAKNASDPVDFVTNTLEIATPPKNPAKITAVNDLAKSGVKVAVCAPAVPCGVVAAKVFANAKVKVKPTASEADVKSTLAAVISGEVDAGLVYVTDVRAAGSKVHGVQIPANLNASTAYPIAALTKAKNPQLAQAFVTYVRSSAGMTVLLADGFSKP